MSWLTKVRNFKKRIFRRDKPIMNSYPNKETYNFFKEKNPDINITPKEYYEIIKKYIEMAVDKTIEHRDGFEFTGYGHMIIISRPITEKTHNINTKLSSLHDTEIKHLNLHSEGRLCKFIFSNKSKKYKIRNKRLWTFNFNNVPKLKVSKAFKKNYGKYLRVYKMGHVGKRLMDY